MKDRREKQETKNILLLHSYGDNRKYGCWKLKCILFKKAEFGFMPSHLCVRPDLRVYLATSTFSIHLFP